MKFIPSCNDKTSDFGNKDYLFIFAGMKLLVDKKTVPLTGEIKKLLADAVNISEEDYRCFGTIGDKKCFAVAVSDDAVQTEIEDVIRTQKTAFDFVLLRGYLVELNENISAAAAYASHLMHWDKNSRFCGRCGNKTKWASSECAKTCVSCGYTQYPRISPAIIIIISKENKILLAHNKNFPEGRYSLLAGFLEMGETIEEAAAREVYEETAIKIKNIEYISSQSWPFPDSLMIGLKAEWESGDIEPDGHEITDAGWYSRDEFPSIPGHGTIARKLIDKFTKT